VAGQSFRSTCPPGYAVSKFVAYSEKTSSGKWDVTYKFFYKRVVRSVTHNYIKRRYTKFVKSSSTSEISCKDEESLCGVLSDYDKSGDRLYAFQCCDNSNVKSAAGKDEEKTVTVNFQDGSFQESKSSQFSKVVKSLKIVSISESSATYSVTYSKYRSCSSRFTESSTTKEYSGKTTEGSGSASKEAGKKKRKWKKNSSSAKKEKGGKSGKKGGGGSGKKGGDGGGSGKKGKKGGKS
jgi:hypothetical protein